MTVKRFKNRYTLSGFLYRRLRETNKLYSINHLYVAVAVPEIKLVWIDLLRTLVSHTRKGRVYLLLAKIT